MTMRAVHWHEGMFLRPSQFQTAFRGWAHVSQRGSKWDSHYNWGLRAIELDLDALANFRLVVRTIEARLRDGTALALPEEGLLPALDLKPVFQQRPSATVFLAVPLLHLGRANVATSAE